MDLVRLTEIEQKDASDDWQIMRIRLTPIYRLDFDILGYVSATFHALPMTSSKDFSNLSEFWNRVESGFLRAEFFGGIVDVSEKVLDHLKNKEIEIYSGRRKRVQKLYDIFLHDFFKTPYNLAHWDIPQFDSSPFGKNCISLYPLNCERISRTREEFIGRGNIHTQAVRDKILQMNQWILHATSGNFSKTPVPKKAIKTDSFKLLE